MSRPAYRADDRPIDRADFYAIACDPGRSCVVEACAGAGKTWMLVSRILRALLDGAEPQDILAITFTRKAAGEMRERLDDWLATFGSPGASHSARVRALTERGLTELQAARLAPQLGELQAKVLLAGRPVEIRTFHAWFAQLLRAAPLELLEELGLRPDMELIETLDDHRPAVFRRFHAALLRDPELLAEHRTLIAMRGRSQARKWFETALERRVELELAATAGVLEGSVPYAGAPGSGDPVAALRGASWQARMARLVLLVGDCGNRTEQASAAELGAALEGKADGRSLFRHLRTLCLTKEGAPRKQLGKVAAIAALQDDLERLSVEVHQWDAHAEHLRMVRLTRVLLAEYRAYKRLRGLADMADLEACGLALLRDSALSGWVQERLDSRVRHLLIDEFQDTSPLQWQALLAWLSGYGGAGGGISGQRPPSVFIVGDPKQSIYRFRRAEPRVFEAAKRFVVDALGGRVLACDHTRRNVPAVLAAINSVFLEATDGGEFDGFRTHTTEVEAGTDEGRAVAAFPRVPRPPRATKAPGIAAPERVWRDTLTVPRHTPEEALKEREAALVAEGVRALLAPTPDGAPAALAARDILVLSRKRESLRFVAKALRRLHVPYAAVEDFELTVAPEARDLIAVLDVLVSPRHRLSLAQALRSPLFGASDDDLLALARAAVHDDWWHALMAGPQPGAALQRAAGLLRDWHLAAARLPPHDLLDRIVHEGDLHARVAATVPPEQRLAAMDAIDAVLGQALTLDGARYATPYNFVRTLKRRTVKIAAPGQADAVRLLTVHGAKGLEARVVFVMDADPQPKKTETTTLLVEWPVESAAPRRCAFVYSESSCSAALSALLATELEARRREELNGLYVAMTRARERLVFSATEPQHRSGVSWWQRLERCVPSWAEEAPATLPAEPGGTANPVTASTVVTASPAAMHTAARAPTDVAASPPALLRMTEPLRRLSAPTAFNPGTGPGDDARRLGLAVHRFLEWALGPASASADPAALARAAAAEFGVTAVQEVGRLASRILESPECRPFFGGPHLRWAGNEVPMNDAGETLRIDRLVQTDDGSGPVWWILDYKLHESPAQLPAYREQLRRYRRLVQQAQPGSPVRCAFITGSGALVEVD